jgi:signal transduction histidine kinase
VKQTIARRNWSLSARLGWRLALLTLLAVLLAAGAMAWRAIATVHELDDSALQNQVRLVAAHLPLADLTGRLTMPDELIAPFRASDGDNLFMVYAGRQRVATSDPIAADEVAGLLPRPLRDGLVRLPATRERARGMVGLVTSVGPWRVVVLQGREQSTVLLDTLAGNFLLGALWLLLPIGLAMICVAVLTVRRGLRPLREVSEAAALVGPSLPGARLPVVALPAEIAPLVLAMNAALSRLELALLAQRRFVAEAAHALRTPLAVLTARLDQLADVPEIDALRHDTDRMSRLVGQMLSMARLEGLPLDVTQRVELRAVAVEAISGLVPLGLQAGVTISLREAALAIAVRGNQAALVLALTNLLENALSFAPAGSEVEVAIELPARITVCDRGQGVPVELRHRIFGRFDRGPSPHAGGAGLGLAIVSEIAVAHGGSIGVTDRAGGGAAFSLTLEPLAQQ